MTALRVVATRGGLVESSHRVSVAAVRADGTRVAWSGDPDLVTFWRSAAKPFQALPLVSDGAADRWRLSAEELALACGSHSSEAEHLRVVDGFLRKIGCEESDLVCRGHPPLSQAGAEHLAGSGGPATARWSNCSGKHTAMLALARHHDWPEREYERDGHPVQQRMLREVSRWTDLPEDAIGRGVDGCGVQTFALPVSAMALAYARFGMSSDTAVARLRQAMTQCPFMVAGTGRLCTELMEASGGAVIAKVGADGVYGASLPHDGIGIGVKVEDGDYRSAAVAVLAVLDALQRHAGFHSGVAHALRGADRFRTVPIHNTRGTVTGALEPVGGLQFSS